MKSGSRSLQRRLRSVRSIAQLTRAMKTVAVSKYNRVQNQWNRIAPYQEALTNMAAAVGTQAVPDTAGRKVLYMIFTANRGLCGSYNSELWSFVKKTLAQQDMPYDLLVAGHWGILRAQEQMPQHLLGTVPMNDLPTAAQAWDLAERLETAWASGEYASIILLAQSYKNIMNQVPAQTVLFPAPGHTQDEAADVLMLPEREKLAAHIQNRALRIQLYVTMLASMTGAHGAMLMAMRSASDNAETMVSDIERRVNRLRQTSVTTQVLELARGAQNNQS